MTGQISRLVLAILSKDSRETLERWQFDVTMEAEEEGAACVPLPFSSFALGQAFSPRGRAVACVWQRTNLFVLALRCLLQCSSTDSRQHGGARVQEAQAQDGEGGPGRDPRHYEADYVVGHVPADARRAVSVPLVPACRPPSQSAFG